MKKNLVTAVIVLAVFLGGLTVFMQFRPVVDNPPVTQAILAPPEVLGILQKSCFDCHSNQTRITWLQKLPIVRLMVASDVKGARSILNFTEWDKYTPMEKDGLIYMAVMAAEHGQMPPEDYLMIHADAKLTKDDKAVLQDWLASIRPQ